MAEEARKTYLDIPLDCCFSSPLVRARETAEIVLRGRGVPIETDERLREMSFGDYEGIENSFDVKFYNNLARKPHPTQSVVG